MKLSQFNLFMKKFDNLQQDHLLIYYESFCRKDI
jgi:hypothetical protein